MCIKKPNTVSVSECVGMCVLNACLQKPFHVHIWGPPILEQKITFNDIASHAWYTGDIAYIIGVLLPIAVAHVAVSKIVKSTVSAV